MQCDDKPDVEEEEKDKGQDKETDGVEQARVQEAVHRVESHAGFLHL